MPETPDVRPGQIWEDRDPRHAGRTIRIDKLVALGTGSRRTHAMATVLTVSRNVSKHRIGRTTRPIALSRFRDYNRGYRLVEEDPA